MNQQEMDDLRKLLQRSVHPVGRLELQRDLWPNMLRRLDQPTFHVPWWDWALLAAATALLLFFPGMIPALLYHL